MMIIDAMEINKQTNLFINVFYVFLFIFRIGSGRGSSLLTRFQLCCVTLLRMLGLDVILCVGQCFDGAVVMSGRLHYKVYRFMFAQSANHLVCTSIVMPTD